MHGILQPRENQSLGPVSSGILKEEFVREGKNNKRGVLNRWSLTVKDYGLLLLGLP